MLNERNQANKERKNQVLGRTPKTPPREHADREVHDHGSNPETVGEKRGVKKVRGQKKDVPGLLKRIYKQSGLRTRAERAKTMLKRFTSGPKGKLPERTVYHDMGYLMAEALGLVSETTNKSSESVTAAQRARERQRRKEHQEGIAAEVARRRGEGGSGQPATGRGAATQGRPASGANPYEGAGARIARRYGRSPSA